MIVWPEGSRSATAERMATVLPVPTSPVIMAMVLSATAQAMRAAASPQSWWGGGRAGAGASSRMSSWASAGGAGLSPPRVAWFRERTAPAAVRARARVWSGESVTAFLPLFLLLFWFFLLLRFLRAADEELVGD